MPDASNIELIHATQEHEEVLSNLMQFYIYDFSSYVDYDVNENGLFAPYPHLEEYFTNIQNKYPFLIKIESQYAGFVLVKKLESEEFSIAEFFVMGKYRGQGIGKTVAMQIFNLYKGLWEVHQRESNLPAQQFWIKVIKEYTKGQFSDQFKNGRRIQQFQNY